MPEIEPKMVDGKWVCSIDDCSSVDDCKYVSSSITIGGCFPYYRARVTKLEAREKFLLDAIGVLIAKGTHLADEANQLLVTGVDSATGQSAKVAKAAKDFRDYWLGLAGKV